MIQTTTLFGSAANILVSAMCFGFLLTYWPVCGNCDRPLRWHLLVQSILQIAQLPVRLVFYLAMRSAAAAGTGVEACVVAVTASPAWQVSKLLMMIQYCWFILGVVWW